MVERSQRSAQNVLTRRPRNYLSQGEEEEEKKVHYLDSRTIQQQQRQQLRTSQNAQEESKTIESRINKAKKGKKKGRRQS